MRQKIEEVLRREANLGVDPQDLGPDVDLHSAGMTSFASVNVMLALEDEFEVEFPDRLLNRSVFSTIANLERALGELVDQPASAEPR